MSNIEASIASLIEVFKELDLNYNQHEENVFSIRLSGDIVEGVYYFIDFDEDSNSVSIIGMDIASFGDKLAQGYAVANRLNHKHRWSNFIIHQNGDINTRIDAIIEPETAGKEIMQLIARNIQTLDSVYPEIMKEILG